MSSRQSHRSVLFLTIVLVLVPAAPKTSRAGDLPAFPGAVGQGAASCGGRGGDVYHVVSLNDYNPQKGQPAIPGSLRHGIDSADGPRTIVFDVGGALGLACPLMIDKQQLTIAGQTAPGGITLWGYPVEVSGASDVVVRHMRVRLGDFHADGSHAGSTEGNRDLVASSANAVDVNHGCDRVVLDHLSTSWGIDETLSVTNSRNVTVQNCIIAESLNDSFHPKGPHGYGSLLRGMVSPDDQASGRGGYTFFGNLWSQNSDRNPSIGGQQRIPPGRSESERLRTDVNVINNVIFGWGIQPSRRSLLGDVRLNLIGNYYIVGPDTKTRYIFRESCSGTTGLYHKDNWLDTDQDSQHDGQPVDQEKAFPGFGSGDRLVSAETGEPFNFLDGLSGVLQPACDTYDKILRHVGASLHRDAIDERIIRSVIERTGGMIDSQEELRGTDGTLRGLDDLQASQRPTGFDTDRDGMPNAFETYHGLDPNDPSDRNATELSTEGYTNLEVYLNSLVVPQARVDEP